MYAVLVRGLNSALALLCSLVLSRSRALALLCSLVLPCSRALVLLLSRALGLSVSFSRSLVLSFSLSLVLLFFRSLVLSFSRSLVLSFSRSLCSPRSPTFTLLDCYVQQSLIRNLRVLSTRLCSHSGQFGPSASCPHGNTLDFRSPGQSPRFLLPLGTDRLYSRARPHSRRQKLLIKLPCHAWPTQRIHVYPRTRRQQTPETAHQTPFRQQTPTCSQSKHSRLPSRTRRQQTPETAHQTAFRQQTPTCSQSKPHVYTRSIRTRPAVPSLVHSLSLSLSLSYTHTFDIIVLSKRPYRRIRPERKNDPLYKHTRSHTSVPGSRAAPINLCLASTTSARHELLPEEEKHDLR